MTEDDEMRTSRRKWILASAGMVALPGLGSVSVVADEDDEDDESPDSVFDMWDNPMVFISTLILAGGAIGLASKSMAVASFSAFLMFVVLAVETDYQLLENILMVVIVLIAIGMAMKLWRMEGTGDT